MHNPDSPLDSTPQAGSTLVDISVVIPVFNEFGGIDQCYREVVACLEKKTARFQIIFVDDGSSDGSTERLRAIAAADNRVILVKLIHNIGQQPAMYTGLGFATGRAVITYDSDLQFHPDCLPELAEKIFEGYDIVGGVRTAREDPLLVNRFPSWIGRKLINKALRADLADFGGVKAYSARMVRMLLSMDAPKIVIPAMAYSASRNAIEIPVRHQSRASGQSKWSILSRMELYLDVYTLYAQRPFEWMMLGGLASIMAGVLLAIGVIFYRIFISETFSGLIIFFDLFLLVTGTYFFSLALIGEFVVRNFRGGRFQAGRMIDEVVNAEHGEIVDSLRADGKVD